MKAIILAAGKGFRLNASSDAAPKCVLRVGGKTLLERQINALESAGIREIVVVVGYRERLVREVGGSRCEYVTNELYDTTNSLYSLWLAKDHLRNGFVVLNGDVLLDPSVLRDFLASPAPDALLFDPTNNRSLLLGPEEMKVRVHDGHVIEISKSIDPLTADGENVGIVKFSSEGANQIVRHMDSLISNGNCGEWAPRAFQEFARQRPLYAFSIGSHPWIEIDYPEDYRVACDEILPMIEQVADAPRLYRQGLSIDEHP